AARALDFGAGEPDFRVFRHLQLQVGGVIRRRLVAGCGRSAGSRIAVDGVGGDGAGGVDDGRGIAIVGSIGSIAALLGRVVAVAAQSETETVTEAKTKTEGAESEAVTVVGPVKAGAVPAPTTPMTTPAPTTAMAAPTSVPAHGWSSTSPPRQQGQDDGGEAEKRRQTPTHRYSPVLVGAKAVEGLFRRERHYSSTRLAVKAACRRRRNLHNIRILVRLFLAAR